MENTESYFLSCFVVIPNLKDTVFGGVYGMDETSDFGVCNYCAIEIYHWDGCLPGRSGSEALGSEALISQSTGLGRIEAVWLMDSDAPSSKTLDWV